MLAVRGAAPDAGKAGAALAGQQSTHVLQFSALATKRTRQPKGGTQPFGTCWAATVAVLCYCLIFKRGPTPGPARLTRGPALVASCESVDDVSCRLDLDLFDLASAAPLHYILAL